MTSLRNDIGCGGLSRQKGLIAIFVTAAFLFIAGIATFAIDINHAYMDKSKLQNAVDSAALAAATVINGEGTVENGDATVVETLDAIIGFGGNSELAEIKNYLEVTYSDDPTNGASFVDSASYSSSSDYIYVRVAIAGYPLNNFLITLFGVDKYVSASAVAGPSASTTPNAIVPIAVCQGSDDVTDSGYINGQVYAVKSTLSALGSGNFQYLALEDATGADILSESLAGGYNGDLAVGDSILTEPGGNTNKGINGVNSRLGTQQRNSLDATLYPPDKYTKEPEELAEIDSDGNVLYYEDDPDNAWHYDDYEAELKACVKGASNDDCNTYYNSSAANDRRTLIVPVVDCSGGPSGRTYVTITKFACFFLLQSMDKIGNELAMFGEFIESCPVTSGGGYDLDNGTQYRVVLFNDPNSEGS